jgi:hypothetical protein
MESLTPDQLQFISDALYWGLAVVCLGLGAIFGSQR